MSSASPDDDRTVIQPRTGGEGATPASAPEVPAESEAPVEPAPLSPAAPAAKSAGPAANPAAAAAPAKPPTPAAPGRSSASSAGDSGNALPAGTYLGEFELTGVLGEGGFGIVYIAQDHSLQRRVALKEYMPSALAARTDQSRVQVRSERYRETFEAGLKSFVNEARLLAQFDHPSLVKVYRFWEANGTAYMVMPLYEGITLKDKLKRMPAPPDEAWLMAMLAPLTEALAVIHAESCFHRDIAPDNVILLAGSERPLLLDFGAARRVISDMTQALTVILKPGYAPVEQYAEVPEMKQGAWTDVYALAATVHYAVMGKTPPPSVGRLMNDTFQPVSVSAAGRYSPGFLQALDNALAVRPSDRTPGIAALRQDLGLPPAGALDAPTQIGASAADLAALRSVQPRAATPSQASAPFPQTQITRAPERQQAETMAPAAAQATAGTAAQARGSNKGLMIGAAALVLVGAGVAGYMMSRSPKATAPATVAAGTAAPAAPSAPPATTVAAAPKGFEIREEFNKVLSGQLADFKVQAAAAQKTLRIGRDKLSFNVSSARDGFVQVLVLGPDGSLLLLFPNAQSSDNRIKAGQTLKLPQANWLLDTSEPAGSEEFLVVVSAQPRDYSELSKQREYIFLKLPTGQQGAELANRWTRSTPLLLGSLKNCPTADCEAYGAASFSVAIEH
jgi:serine/threonine protein kinase